MSSAIPEPVLVPALVERVLAKLGLPDRPPLDLAGLNGLYAVLCGKVPFDNLQKRIWFAGDRTKPFTGGDPSEFWENWVHHGTGGTCWPSNGGMFALAHALGYRTRRIAGSVIVPGYPLGGNHGSVLILLDGIDYLFDLTFGGFKVLPLVSGQLATTGTGINELLASPVEGDGFVIFFWMGWDRDTYLPFRPERDPVSHAYFLERYDRTKTVGFFNDTLLISRRSPESVLTIGRYNRLVVDSNGTLSKTPLTEAQRKAALIEDFGISEELVEKLPPDKPDGIAPF